MILAILLLAVVAEVESELDCTRDDLAQQELNICARMDFEQADKALNTQWKLNAAEMKRIDAEYSDLQDDGGPSYYDALLAAQRAWIAFRDANCRVSGYEMRGGSAEPMMVSGCMARMTKERTKELRDSISTQ